MYVRVQTHSCAYTRIPARVRTHTHTHTHTRTCTHIHTRVRTHTRFELYVRWKHTIFQQLFMLLTNRCALRNVTDQRLVTADLWNTTHQCHIYVVLLRVIFQSLVLFQEENICSASTTSTCPTLTETARFVKEILFADKRSPPLSLNHLVGLVVKASASGAEDPGFESRLRRDFSGTPVATVPGVWRYRVSAGTGRPGVSILWLDGVESLICNFYFSVAARKIVWADPSLRYTGMLLGR